MKQNTAAVANIIPKKDVGQLQGITLRLEDLLSGVLAMAEDTISARNGLLGPIPTTSEQSSAPREKACNFSSRATELLYDIEQALSDARTALRDINEAL